MLNKMLSKKVIVNVCLFVLCLTVQGWTQEIQHEYLCSDIGAERVFKVSASGEITWEYPALQCADAWLLPKGNVLMSFTAWGTMVKRLLVVLARLRQRKRSFGNTKPPVKCGVVSGCLMATP